jgi:hypothetical protein
MSFSALAGNPQRRVFASKDWIVKINLTMTKKDKKL